MIDDNNKRRSMVLPKWLEYNKSINNKELRVPRAEPFHINSYTKNQIKKQLSDFVKNPNVFKAADLMGAALNVNDLETMNEMAQYVLKHSGVQKPTINLAKKILSNKVGSTFDPKVLITDNRIANLKKKVIQYPHNSINWMELARCYTIKGQNEKATKAARISLTLSPSNRYLVRSGVRYFVHIGDYDIAYHYIKKALNQVHDPWIKALKVSLSSRISIKLERTKKLIPTNLSPDQLFHFSELIESVGMLELEAGNIKSAKKRFKIAWQNPSESVIRHGEWVLRNKLPSIDSNLNLDYSSSHEALAWNNFYKIDLERALENVIEWELEEPYSASPYILGCHISDNLEKYDTAIDFAQRGLLANPKHFMLTNNLCYTLTKQNKLDEANTCLMSLSSNVTQDEMLYYNATSGLYQFKKGNVKKGRELYNKTLKKCKDIGDQRLFSKAALNLAIAETERSTENHVKIIDSAMRASKSYKDEPSIYLLRKKLIGLVNDKK